MTIMRHAGSRVIPESWGCVFERGPVAKPAGGSVSASGEPESLGLPESGPDKTHLPTQSPAWQSAINEYAAMRRADAEDAVRTLVLSPHGAFWRTQSALGVVTVTPVACEHSEALQSAVAAASERTDG